MEAMTIDQLYQETLAKLKRGERPLIKLTPELVESLKSEWQKAVTTTLDTEALKKILCILDNTQNHTREFNELFVVTLEKVKDHELLIYTLAASQKHVVEEALKSGVMISQAYFEKLKTLLKSNDPEVKEWTLRTIETLGPLSLRLKKEVLDAKPGMVKFFNQHQKASSQIIELLEKQWERMMK